MAASVRLSGSIFQGIQCRPHTQKSSRQLHVVRRVHETLAVSAATTPGQLDNDIIVIDWDQSVHDHPSEIPEEATMDWDFSHLSDEMVEASLNDAATFRLIVQRLPCATPNVKELRAFRDNVTRKLAPTIARAFTVSRRTWASQPRVVGLVIDSRAHDMLLIEGYAASRLAPQQPSTQLDAAHGHVSLGAHHHASAPSQQDFFGAHLQLIPIHWLSARPKPASGETLGGEPQPSASPACEDGSRQVAAPDAVAAAPHHSSLPHPRHRRRGTGRGSLAHAGRHGLPQAAAEAAGASSGRQLPAGW